MEFHFLLSSRPSGHSTSSTWSSVKLLVKVSKHNRTINKEIINFTLDFTQFEERGTLSSTHRHIVTLMKWRNTQKCAREIDKQFSMGRKFRTLFNLVTENNFQSVHRSDNSFLCESIQSFVPPPNIISVSRVPSVPFCCRSVLPSSVHEKFLFFIKYLC